jgi:hypothetical protein
MRHAERVICETCGTEFITRRKDAKYCSHLCANNKTSANIGVKRGRYDKLVCPHNKYVCCEKKDCINCGWNPMVAKMRSANLKQKLGVAKA